MNNTKNTKISGAFNRLNQRLKSKVSREFLTYAVFFLIAVVIWYLNALNKDYTADLNFKVTYTDLPEDKVLVTATPDRLKLTVNAQGFTLLKYRLGLTFYPIVLEANYRTLRKSNASDSGDYYLTTESVFDKIAGQLGPDARLRQVSPDTLKFLFSETVQKEVPVKPVLKLGFEKGFLPKGKMAIEPKSVTVTGPHAIIDTVKYVHTREKTYKRLNDTLRTEIDLQPVDGLRYSVSEVTITQAIERHTEATVTVPVEPINLPAGLTMKTFPGTVTVSCMVPVGDFEKLQPYLFRVVADYTATENQNKVKVSFAKTPDFVSDARIRPKSVDYIIEK